jgi:hypothetical protein
MDDAAPWGEQAAIGRGNRWIQADQPATARSAGYSARNVSRPSA